MSQPLGHWYNQLLHNPLEVFLVRKDREIVPLGKTSYNHLHITSGSFDPLHNAHKHMHDLTESLISGSSQVNACFEISLSRIGKAILSLDELAKRLNQFTDYADVVVTNAPTYLEKMGCIPQRCSFNIGLDVAEKMVEMHGTLGVRGISAIFYVFDRNGKSVMAMPDVPFNFVRMKMPEELQNISSTEIRNG